MILPPPRSTLFPYTTLFRSLPASRCRHRRRHRPVHDRALRQEHLRSEEHTSELQSRLHLVCRLLLEKKKNSKNTQGERYHYAPPYLSPALSFRTVFPFLHKP